MIDRELVLPNLIRATAEKDPEGVGLQEAGGPGLTWREYDHANRRWAQTLRSVGVRLGEHVATMIPNSAVGVNVWMGASLAGALEVPLNPAFRGAILERLMGISQARTLVIAADNLSEHAASLATLDQLETVVVIGDAGDVADFGKRIVRGDEVAAEADVPADLTVPEYWDLASVVFTSGTSGGSKGVLLPWGHYYASAQAYELLGRGGCLYSPYPFFHYAGRLMAYVAACGGSTLVVREQFSTKDFWAEVRQYGVASAGMLGVWVNFLLNEPEQADDADTPLELVSMAPVVERYEEFRRRFGVRIFGGFGSTEIGTHFTTLDCGDKITSIGKPMDTVAGVEYRLVDEHDQPVPQGEVGELISRHSEPWTVMLGYLGNPEATAAAWRNGWFHSGDSFYQDEEGAYYFVDRTKDVIRRRGENISSLELESLVLEHPDVLEAAAIGVPSEFGEEDVFVLVIPRPDAQLTPESLSHDLDERLPRFMRPRYLELVDEFPRTPATMRVRKFALRERSVSPVTWDREAQGPAQV